MWRAKEAFQKGDVGWVIYEAISLKSTIPWKENCQNASADPDKEYVGLFAVNYDYLKVDRRIAQVFAWHKLKCPEGVLYFGQIDGFVAHAGRMIPYLRKRPKYGVECSVQSLTNMLDQQKEQAGETNKNQ